MDEDAVAVERGLEREVKAADGLDGGKPGHLQGGLDPAALAHCEFLGQQRVDRLDGADLAALELLDHGIEGFRTFSKQKAVFYQSSLNAMSLFNPPYGGLFERLTKFLMR